MEIAKPSFTITQVLSEAWRLVHGNKWPIWAIAIFIGVASILVQFLINWVFHMDPQNQPTVYRFLLMPLINNIVIAPFFGGAVMTAILCARGETVNAKTGFRYLHKSLAVMLTMLIIAILANMLTYLVHLPGVVMVLNLHTGWLNLLAAIVAVLVYVFFFISVPLVVDKNQSPWRALLNSFHIIKQYWFKTLILLILVYAFFIIVMIPLYVGTMIHPYAKLLGAAIMIVALIWLLPFLFMVQGVLYHRLVD